MRRLPPRTLYLCCCGLFAALVLVWLTLPPSLPPHPLLPFREPPWAFLPPADGPDLPAPPPSASEVQFVHQTWSSSSLPPRLAGFRRSWLSCFPEARHLLWTDADNLRLVRRHYPWFARRYQQLPAPIYRSDAARYLLLFHYGGVYADLDTECLRPFSQVLANSSILFGAMATTKNRRAESGLVQNSFMFSRPRHPFWLEMVHYIFARSLKHQSAMPEVVTGPHALMFVLRDYRRRFPESAKDIRVLPPRFFNPFSWMAPHGSCKDRGRMNDLELERCRRSVSNDSFVVQYHFHTWTLPPAATAARR